MSLFDKGARTSPVVNNSQNAYAPNVSLTEDVNYPVAQTAQASANAAEASAEAAASSASDAANSAAASASSASSAADSASQAIQYADGWEEAYDEAQDAVDAANQAINNADVVYYGFINMTADAESVAADQPADAIWNSSTYNMHFKIPKGADGTMEGLAEVPIIDDPEKSDWILIVDETDNSVKREVIDDFLNMTAKTVNGIAPDANGNINLSSDDSTPTLWIGETVVGSFGSNPAGSAAADGSVIYVANGNYTEVVSGIVSGAIASVTEQVWQSGTNDVFSQGDWNGTDTDGSSMTWFRVPNLNDNGQVTTTNGDFTIEGNWTFDNPVSLPAITGVTTQDGDLIITDTSRGVGIDSYIINRAADEGTDYNFAAHAFIDRKDQNKVLGGLFADHDSRAVGVLSNLGDANLASQVGAVNIEATAGKVNVNGSWIDLNADTTITGTAYADKAVISGDLTVSGNVDTSAGTMTTGAINAGHSCTVAGNFSVTGNLNASGSTHVIAGTGSIELEADTNVTGGLSTTEGVTVAGDFKSNGYAYFTQPVSSVGTITLGNSATFAGTDTTGATKNLIYINGVNDLIEVGSGSDRVTITNEDGHTVFDTSGTRYTGNINYDSATVVSGESELLLVPSYNASTDFVEIGRTTNEIFMDFHTAAAAGSDYVARMAIQGTPSDDGYQDIVFSCNGLYHGSTPVTTQKDIEAIHAEYRPIIEELKAEIATLKEKVNG